MQYLTVALDMMFNENENPYPVQDSRFRAKLFDSMDDATQYSDELFDKGAIDTLIIDVPKDTGEPLVEKLTSKEQRFREVRTILDMIGHNLEASKECPVPGNTEWYYYSICINDREVQIGMTFDPDVQQYFINANVVTEDGEPIFVQDWIYLTPSTREEDVVWPTVDWVKEHMNKDPPLKCIFCKKELDNGDGSSEKLDNGDEIIDCEYCERSFYIVKDSIAISDHHFEETGRFEVKSDYYEYKR